MILQSSQVKMLFSIQSGTHVKQSQYAFPLEDHGSGVVVFYTLPVLSSGILKQVTI